MPTTCYLISYDLADADESDYQALAHAIKQYKRWAHITESLWAVVTDQTAKQVRDDLLPYLTDGSRIFVVKSGVGAAWQNVMCKSEWLKKNL